MSEEPELPVYDVHDLPSDGLHLCIALPPRVMVLTAHSVSQVLKLWLLMPLPLLLLLRPLLLRLGWIDGCCC
eukprot:15453546-Alexandrium_andersonii.AAC.1